MASSAPPLASTSFPASAPLAANPYRQYMTSNNATVEIPLETVATQSSQTGLRGDTRSSSSATAHEQSALTLTDSNEKSGGLFRRHKGHRKAMRVDSNGHPLHGGPGDDSEEDSFTSMGRIYSKILGWSAVTKYFIFVLPLGICIAVPIVIGATVAPTASVGGVRIVWLFVWIEIVWVSLWVSKLFSRFLPLIFQFFAGVVSAGTRKYALVLRALGLPLTLAGWALCSLATFTPLMTRNPDARAAAAAQAAANQPVTANVIKDWQSVLRSLLAAALVASLIFLGEKIIIQLLSINYHRKQFDGKIKDSKRNVYLLSLLYDASRTLFPAYCKEFAEEDYVINDSIGHTGKPGQKAAPAAPMRLIADVGRFGDKLTSVFGNVAQEITGKNVFNPSAAHSIVVEALEKTASSEALARRLWMSFVVEGRDALYQEDLVEVLGANRRAEAEECFGSLDRDSNGDISLDEMILTVTEFGRERKSIASSMHDVDQAIHVLDSLLGTVVFIICIFVVIAFLNRTFTTTLATAGTALLSLSFVFAATCQEVLGSCIFLFVKHPYDVGDRVDISNEQLTVEKISLLYTLFKRVTNGKLVQVPNIVLNNLWVENITRSNAMREQLSMFVNFDTSFEDVRALKDEMHAFVMHKDNNRDFQPDVEIEVVGIAEMNKLELRIEIRHKSNWSNETIRAARRSKFMCALVLALRKVPIYGPGAGDAALGDASKPTYSVAISHEQAQTQKEAFATTKEAKRLFPSKKPDSKTDSTGKSTGVDTDEQGVLANRATEALNARNPARDPARDETLGYRSSAGVSDKTLADPSRTSLDQGPDGDLFRRESSRGLRRGVGNSIDLPRSGEPAPLFSDYTGYQSYGVPPSAVQPGQQYRRPAAQTPQQWNPSQPQWRP